MNLEFSDGVPELGEYNLLVNKKQRKVRLPDLEKKKTFGVEVDGRTTKVELSQNILCGKPFYVKVGGKPYRIELDKLETNGSITVKVDGATYSVRLENENRVVSPAIAPILPSIEKRYVKTKPLDRGVIVASMPGKVVLLRVKTGHTVRAGDVLLVLESMKMENEITSPINGVVEEVKVTEGMAVNIGEIMVVIK